MAYYIPLHVAVKLSCLTIGLWIFLSKDNVLLLLHYDTGGVHQKCEQVGLKIWKSVLESCHGNLIPMK